MTLHTLIQHKFSMILIVILITIIQAIVSIIPFILILINYIGGTNDQTDIS